MSESSRLSRRLNVFDAVILGLGAMLGTGVFAAVGLAITLAGSAVLFALALAAGAAFCNARSSASLAAAYPESGGTYVYARKQINSFWGWMAGWSFIAGKLASCAAAALTFGVYLFPQNVRMAATAAVVVLTALNYFGIQKTLVMTRFLVSVILLGLFIAILGLLQTNGFQWERLHFDPTTLPTGGVFEAAGILFFAFAGYARIATLGEEVLCPAKTIPKAIQFSLTAVVLIYAAVLGSLLMAADERVFESQAPLLAAVQFQGWAISIPFVKTAAVLASLSVLLTLILGVSRTVFAMAAQGDLPRCFEAVHPRYKVPHRAEGVTAGLILALIWLGDIGFAIGFSAFTILFYYAVTHLCAWRLQSKSSFFTKATAVVGFSVCVVLAVSLSENARNMGLGILLLGGALYLVKRRSRCFRITR